jgi:HEAT repeat protein
MKDGISSLASCVAVWALMLLCVACSAGQAQDDERKVSRKEEINKLIAVIRDARMQDTNPDRVVQAIQRLGEMKATEAVDVLAELLTFRRWLPWEKDPTQPKDEVGVTSDRQRYPATLALLLIGAPALPALIKVIEAHDPGSLETRNALEVIIPLSRYGRAAYVQKLNDAAARAASPEAAQRLMKAAETLKESKR